MFVEVRIKEDIAMLNALVVFLIGCLVLVIVLYVFKAVINMMDLPPESKQIALLIVGVIALIILIMLTVSAFHAGGGQGMVIL